MNETLQTIHNRRSIRKFQPQQIEESVVEAIVQAGLMAPSGMNLQQWHFTVIQNQTLLDEMVAAAVEYAKKSGNQGLIERVMDPKFHIFYHAPTVILISYPASANGTSVDGAMAAQNICLAATSLGVGSCMIGFSTLIFQSEKGQAFLDQLGVPENYQHFCTVSLGYVEGEVPAAPERKQDVINYVK